MTAEFPRDYITASEAIERLGVSRNRGYQMLRLGVLPSHRHNGKLYVAVSAVDERLADLEVRDGCITTLEVAEFFGVRRRAVDTWVHDGLLHPTKIAAKLCYDLDEIIRFRPPGHGNPRRLPAPRVLRGVVHPEPAEWSVTA
jgi:hypothetical protein